MIDDLKEPTVRLTQPENVGKRSFPASHYIENLEGGECLFSDRKLTSATIVTPDLIRGPA